MKIGQIIIGLLFGVLIGFGFSKFLTKNETSQKITNKKTTEISADASKWKYDENLDAIKAAPNSHKIVYEDSSVRILEVILNEKKKPNPYTLINIKV